MLFGRRQRSRSRILIVEDEPLVAFENEHFLSDAGYPVVATLGCCADALAAIARGGIDLVVTDVRLSGEGDGLDVARAARLLALPVLFVTGARPEEARALAAGCLEKPYSARDLLAAIEAIEDKAAGRAPKRVPRGLTLFG